MTTPKPQPACRQVAPPLNQTTPTGTGCYRLSKGDFNNDNEESKR